jgi:hypothetical protein
MAEPQYQPKNIDEELQLRRLQQEYQGIAHRDVTTAKLARTVAIIFGVLVIVHYGAVITFAALKETATVDALQSIFHEWLPVLSGFLGAAISYYFADRKK